MAIFKNEKKIMDEKNQEAFLIFTSSSLFVFITTFTVSSHTAKKHG